VSNRAARQRPDRPYRPISPRRLWLEFNQRLRQARGPRAHELMAALIFRWPQTRSGIVYLGDSCLDNGHAEHRCTSCRRENRQGCPHPYCCAARLMGNRCGKTAQRAKFDLMRAGIVRLHGAGPGVRAGGMVLNSRGQAVPAATGYELEPLLFASRPAGSTPPPESMGRPTGRPPAPTAQPATLEAGREKMRVALERLRGRAGP